MTILILAVAIGAIEVICAWLFWRSAKHAPILPDDDEPPTGIGA
jgi:hypothetical protein